jgi:uncharacterized membrane protein YsdA (DUF1294 family)
MTILAFALLGVVSLALYALGMRHAGAIYLLAINLVSASLVGIDKLMARAQRWRIPEKVLLGTALLGGSPLAWGAMQAFRHKTVKASYQAKFIGIAFLQALLIGAWLYWWLTS